MFRRFIAARGVAVATAIGGALLALAALPVQAQEAAKPAAAAPGAAPAVPVIIVIDPDRIMRESVAGRGVNAEAEKYAKGFEDQGRKEEASLQAEAQQLEKEQSTLPKEQFEPKRLAFEQKAAEVRREQLRRRQAFDKSVNTAMDQVQRAMIDAAKDVAAQRKADMVVLRPALLFYNSQLDASGEIMDLMNKRLAQVDFPPPMVEAEAPGAAPAAAAQPTSAAKPKAAAKDKPQLNLQLQQQQ